MSKKPSGPQQRRILNKTARYEYHILQTQESGISLKGTEVKSIREGRASLDEAFALIKDGEIFLVGCNIQTYAPATSNNHDPLRKRKLLLHRNEIKKLYVKVKQAGHTLIPLAIYFNENGIAKVELALAKGKTHADKRESIKKRDHQRDIDRAMRRR